MPLKKGSGNVLIKIVILLSTMVVALAGALGFIIYSFPNNQGNANVVDAIAKEDSDEDLEALKVYLDVETIYDNIFIGGIAVGGLTKSEAIKELNSKIQEPSDEKIIEIKYVDTTYDYPFKDFYAKYDIKKKVEEAYAYGRRGTLHERNAQVIKLKTEPLKLELNYSFDDSSIEFNIFSLSEALYVEAKEPSMKRQDDTFIVTEGIDGVQLDMETMIHKIRELLAAETGGTVDAVLIPLEPKFTPKDLENAKSLIGTYQTTFNTAQKERSINLANASSRINNVMLLPKQVFSTNFHFGETTYENGYRMAPVIVNGKLEDDLGGGVCQVSSTLYNAILAAELAIVERVNHSLKVSYVDYGYDATLAGDYIDFKFKNSTEYPVLIESYIKNNKVIVNVYGNEIHSKDRRLVFRNKAIQENPPQAEIVKEDPSLPLGQKVVDVAAKSGFKYEVHKDVYEGDKLVETVLINTSSYKSVRGESRIGTGPPAPEEENTETVSVEGNTQENVVTEVAEKLEPEVAEKLEPEVTETLEPLPIMPDA